jgi:hypothetical protein
MLGGGLFQFARREGRLRAGGYGGRFVHRAAVLSVLASVTEPASATALAVRFPQGRRILPQVEAVLAALVRVGGLVTTPDSGRSFLPRRAA